MNVKTKESIVDRRADHPSTATRVGRGLFGIVTLVAIGVVYCTVFVAKVLWVTLNRVADNAERHPHGHNRRPLDPYEMTSPLYYDPSYIPGDHLHE